MDFPIFPIGVLEGRARGTAIWKPHPLRETSERTSLRGGGKRRLDLPMERAAEPLEKNMEQLQFCLEIIRW